MVWMWILIVIVVPPAAVQACDEGWFGPKCQYQCHRTNNTDCTGGCPSGSKWVGIDCQYEDLMYTYATEWTPQVLLDQNDDTCVSDQNLQSVSMGLTKAFPLTWLRLVVKRFDLNAVLSLNVQLQGPNGENVTCSNMRKLPHDRYVLDIFCDGDVAVQSFKITGEGVKKLCSVFYTGGRNIALKETATQSSVFIALTGYSYGANLAVDGNTAQDASQLNSCTVTTRDDSAPYWRVDFSQPRMVTRYVLYKGSYELKGFRLTSYAADNTSVFTYQDSQSEPQDVYVITSVGITIPVSYVVIRAAVGTASYQSFCEVEIYGDSACEDGMYGFECSKTCSSACATTAHTCEVSNGACSQCQPGMTGMSCSLDCPSTFYGLHCQGRCSANCEDQNCDKVTGYCDKCLLGKRGNFCEQDCPSTKYGAGCVLPCSDNCVNQLCDGASGRCNICPSGKSGDQCDQGIQVNTEQSSSLDSGLSEGAGVGIGLGVVAVIGLVGVAIYCYWKRTSARKRQPCYDVPEPNPDEHTYGSINNTATDNNRPTDMTPGAATPNSPPENTSQDSVQYVNAIGQYEEPDNMYEEPDNMYEVPRP